MRKILLVFILSMLAGSSVYADSAVQQDQNAGFLALATSSFVISPATATLIVATTPASRTVFLAQYPGGQWVKLPYRTRGFIINAFDGDMIVGEPSTMTTGVRYIGVKIASGTAFKWESVSPDQSTIKFMLKMSGTATGTATFCAWGQ